MVSLSFRFKTKILNLYKIISIRSMEPKTVSCGLVCAMHPYGFSFESFPQKKFFDQNFSKSRIFDFQNWIKSELLTRSSSKERR